MIYGFVVLGLLVKKALSELVEIDFIICFIRQTEVLCLLCKKIGSEEKKRTVVNNLKGERSSSTNNKNKEDTNQHSKALSFVGFFRQF